ncbi:hypothetical protein LEP48_13775 [Isoptericola sp. NEAU-Y5]|uniref:Uncharacterized protein n=1 Tax=Isoptericola luteus TaxID=2879484 RepID=A0ABS7ZHB5_9MICO|nr:hypothetical protein [Isoptericola sp. NEAU-Y5]MCA5894407.1 hypothetical protein [Isoptericola sp. NEAU-Y5]
MNEDERTGRDRAGDDDEAFARLEAADPAAGTTPREGVLRAKVDALRAEDGAGLGAGLGAGHGVGAAAGDGGAGGRSEPGRDGVPDGVLDGAAPAGTKPGRVHAVRRQRLPWLAAACVAGVVAVGGGGYLLGSGTQAPGAADAAGHAEAAVVLGGGARGGEDSGGAGPATEQEGAADSASSTAGDSTMPSWYSSGRALFRADGLSGERGSAAAYGFDASRAATREGVARVAEALGAEGEPRWDYGSWAVGSPDGSGPSVWVSVDGTATFGYNDPAADPWRCEQVETSSGEDPREGSDSLAEGEACTPSGKAVSEDAATSALRDVMERLGTDPGGFEIVVEEQAPDDPARWVTAHQVIDGKRTGAQWSATVAPKGVAWLDGFLAETVDLGDYPVVSPAEAVERLGDPRYSGSAWPSRFADDGASLEPWAEPTAPTTPPAPPQVGDPVRWPVSDVEIVTARLGLALQHEEGGTTTVAPAYELSDADGTVWSVLAVADEAVDYSAAR